MSDQIETARWNVEPTSITLELLLPESDRGIIAEITHEPDPRFPSRASWKWGLVGLGRVWELKATGQTATGFAPSPEGAREQVVARLRAVNVPVEEYPARKARKAVQLTDRERKALEALDEHIPTPTGEVALKAQIWGHPPVTESTWVRSLLIKLRDRGLVAQFKVPKKTAWTRTPAGTAALG
jgi:hypothetical protein